MRRYLPLLAGALWGTAYPALQVVLESFTPSQIVLVRVLIGTVVLGVAVALLYGRAPFQITRRQVLPLAVLGVLGVGLFYIFQAVAVQFSTPINVSFIISIYPVFVSIAAPFLLQEDLTPWGMVGLLFAIIGAYTIIGDGRLIPLFSSTTFLGDVLALFGAFSFTGYLLLNRAWADRFGFDFLTLTVFAHVFSLPLLVGFLGATGDFSVGTVDPLGVVLLLWLAAGVTAGGLLALNAGLTEERTQVAALRLLLVPLVASGLSVAFLGEPVTPAKFAGGLAISVGIVLPYYGRR
jgi:drug/metabolite transporter (DMT)-like permease